jgi:Phosphodiester glycosidase
VTSVRSEQEAQAGEAPPTSTSRPPRHRRRRRVFLAILVALVALLSPVAWSLGSALTAPGTDSLAARTAEWARRHGAGGIVNWLESLTYTPPKVGGAPAANSPLRAPVDPQPTARRTSGGFAPDVLRPVVPPASPALPGEGQWRVLETVSGEPAVQAAFVRPDAVHTSYTAGIVRIDQRLVRAVYHPGTQDPGGGPWPIRPDLQGSDRVGLLAAFNSAFAMRDSRGGFYDFGRTVGTLNPGAASLVIYRDGHVNIGSWGRDVRLTANVATVRQNLALIVDHGRPVPGLESNWENQWGFTVGNAKYVSRTGLGIAANGDLVFATGSRLSAATLADLLQRGGAVRAMELDINPYWTSFVLYQNRSGGHNERNLLPDMVRSPARYDTTSLRDFIALYAKNS